VEGIILKVVSKAIDCVVYFDLKGKPRPLKFRYLNEEEFYVVVKVDKVIHQELQTFTGAKTWLFQCQSMINGTAKAYEIKFEILSRRWLLYRI
jgi:molybdate-binding protein